MPVSKAAVSELVELCGLPAKECRPALAEHGGDVQATLAALIDARRVKSADLHPDLVSDELYERAAREGSLDLYRRMTQPETGLPGLLGKMADGLDAEFQAQIGGLAQLLHAEKFGGKTAEQLMAEDEAHEAKKRQQLAKVMPEMAGVVPPSKGQQARSMNRIRRRREALEANPVTLELPPFPPMKLTLNEWVGTGVLKAWAGTQERHGAYTSRSSSKASKGTVAIQIERPRDDEDDIHPQPPAAEQVAAYAHGMAHDAAVAAAVMKALVADYKKTRRRWLKQDANLDLPVIDTPEAMRQHVGLGTLHMHGHAKDGLAYYGLELGCTWDEEHGAGVILHGSRVVAVGQADTSFDPHAVEKDGGVPIAR